MFATILRSISRLPKFLALPLLVKSTTSAAEFLQKDGVGVRITVCVVNPQVDTISLHLKDQSNQPWFRLAKLATAERAAGKNVVMAMNAGMFHPNYEPVGLYVEGGKELSPLNTSDALGNFFLKPNGVFFLKKDGKAGVLETSQYAKEAPKVQLATQSGPMLVIAGKIHAAFKQGSSNKNIRNGVGVRADGHVCFAISDEKINLYDFACCFRDTLKCPDALYFDGSVSRMFAEKLNRTSQGDDFGPMLVVAEAATVPK